MTKRMARSLIKTELKEEEGLCSWVGRKLVKFRI